MNSSVKLIFVALFLSSLCSCYSSNDSIFDEIPSEDQITFNGKLLHPSYLYITLVPNPDQNICNKELIANVELLNTEGYSYRENVVAKNGVFDFAYHNDFVEGTYSVVFRVHNSETIIGSTTFYITSEDLRKEYYLRTIEYSNCNF